ncbi:hypothetical protein BEP19_09360 [Ammoniphilus oxalaticus]|uniref:Metallo-beta-lactamase domain-containing protein n=2 Tax=Ammoniphilus oxalaticus TaxID=66863 RepID=A0A419SL37_9BACL|nr:hypothetical protein BEP19_09360 [Ammoniphilus oxalaticus]
MLMMVAVVLSGCAVEPGGGISATEVSTDGKLIAHFIDVDQGDATLLQGPDFTILIDTGRHDRDELVPYLQSSGIKALDLLVVTHPHADHLGQFEKVMSHFEVSEVWMSGDEHTSKTFERALETVLSSDAGYHEPRAGETFTIGSAHLEVIHPQTVTGHLNNGSISTRVTFGDVVFLFSGDAEKEAEQEMLNRGRNIQADIFQLGHHGSSTSNTQPFLEAIKPKVGIYSAGRENEYGHPHREVVDLFSRLNIPLYGTDRNGTMLVVTDGQTYQVKGAQGAELIQTKSETPLDEGPQSLGDCIDINTASKEELIQIKHIGTDYADQLIALRPFGSVDELTRIKGIGEGRLKDIKAEGLACVRR